MTLFPKHINIQNHTFCVLSAYENTSSFRIYYRDIPLHYTVFNINGELTQVDQCIRYYIDGSIEPKMLILFMKYQQRARAATSSIKTDTFNA